LGEHRDIDEWKRFSPENISVDGVYTFANMWNQFLSTARPDIRFSGIVLDLEEGMTITEELITAMKQRYGSSVPFFGVSIGFDQVKLLKSMQTWVDHFYVQMYDFYVPGINAITKKLHIANPFIGHVNDPSVIAEWVKSEVLSDPGVAKMYSKFGSQIYVMWSAQNAASTDCMYPLKSTNMCGRHYEFGTFTASAFNQFISIVTDPSYGIFANVLGHGIFEFDLMPLGWHSY